MSDELNVTWKCIFVHHIFKQSQTKCIKRLVAVQKRGDSDRRTSESLNEV